MIDLAKIKYRLVVMDESKNQYNIKEYVENLGWEENDGELAVRLSFVAKNDKTSKGYLSTMGTITVFNITKRMTPLFLLFCIFNEKQWANFFFYLLAVCPMFLYPCANWIMYCVAQN